MRASGESQRSPRPESARDGAFAPAADERTKREIGDWIVSATLAGTDELGILAGVGQRLNAAGVSVVRISVATDLLDPSRLDVRDADALLRAPLDQIERVDRGLGLRSR